MRRHRPTPGARYPTDEKTCPPHPAARAGDAPAGGAGGSSDRGEAGRGSGGHGRDPAARRGSQPSHRGIQRRAGRARSDQGRAESQQPAAQDRRSNWERAGNSRPGCRPVRHGSRPVETSRLPKLDAILDGIESAGRVTDQNAQIVSRSAPSPKEVRSGGEVARRAAPGEVVAAQEAKSDEIQAALQPRARRSQLVQGRDCRARGRSAGAGADQRRRAGPGCHTTSSGATFPPARRPTVRRRRRDRHAGPRESVNGGAALAELPASIARLWNGCLFAGRVSLRQRGDAVRLRERRVSRQSSRRATSSSSTAGHNGLHRRANSSSTHRTRGTW